MNTQSARATLFPIPVRQVTDSDYKIFEQITLDSECRNCDMSFANIFCWQDSYKSQIALWNGYLLIRFTTERGSTAYMQPLGGEPSREVIDALAADAAQLGEPLRLFGLNEQWREALNTLYPDHFAISHYDANSDYIYLSTDLATLAGRKYQPKRNFINRFVSRYSYRFEGISAANIDHCRALNSRWCDQRKELCDRGEQRALHRALDNFSTLPLEGWILYVDDIPCAFAIGSAVNHDTFCIHIEKVDTTFEGAGAMINNLVAVELQHRFKYINREDDLGIEGLRRAKQSYYPVELIKKYSALQLSQTEQQMQSLWSEVFGDAKQDIDDFFVKLYDPALAFTHTADNQVVAMLHIVPLQRETERIAYIYAVATKEPYRRKGIASALLQSALRTIERGGFHRAMLIPADQHSAKFYEQFGFSATGELFNSSEFGIDYDLGTGNSEQDFVMERKIY